MKKPSNMSRRGFLQSLGIMATSVFLGETPKAEPVESFRLTLTAGKPISTGPWKLYQNGSQMELNR